MIIKRVWYWYKDRPIAQWNRIEIPEVNSYIYGYLIFLQNVKAIQKGRIIILTNDARTIRYPYAKKNSNHYFVVYVKEQLKMDHKPKCMNHNYKASRKYRKKIFGTLV